MRFQPQQSNLAKFIRGRGKRFLKVLLFLTLVVVSLLGFWFILKVMLNAEYPMLPVSSGDMCTAQPHCNCLLNPFTPTLHIGDLVIVQGINPREISVGDIIVFHKPKPISGDLDILIVHRVNATEINPNNGMIYFETKGDANSGSDPYDYDYRGENYTWHDKISEKLVAGKVVLRIPWIGHVALFMHNSSGILIIMALIIIIVIMEFVVPAFISKETEPKKDIEKAFET